MGRACRPRKGAKHRKGGAARESGAARDRRHNDRHRIRRRVRTIAVAGQAARRARTGSLGDPQGDDPREVRAPTRRSGDTDRRPDAACRDRDPRPTGPHYGDRMKNFGDLRKMAQRMQADMAKAQEDLAALTVEGTAGGGAVVVVMSGTQECKQVRIKKDAVDPEDVETLEDLVRAATTDALAKSKQLAADRLGGPPGGPELSGPCRPQARRAR